ncbi:hypothetical protein ACIQGO_25480 [Streptomyces shenzhenensis]|uniref:hypothetical protein n=1 Tax=Streptomyces shenzhenensis TaxID=943815 RepID=UPI0037F32CDD
MRLQRPLDIAVAPDGSLAVAEADPDRVVAIGGDDPLTVRADMVAGPVDVAFGAQGALLCDAMIGWARCSVEMTGSAYRRVAGRRREQPASGPVLFAGGMPAVPRLFAGRRHPRRLPGALGRRRGHGYCGRLPSAPPPDNSAGPP